MDSRCSQLKKDSREITLHAFFESCILYIYIYICTARCNLYDGLPGQLTPVSQDSVSEADSPSAGHDPPFASTISFDLIFTRLPDPHVFEQGPNVH